MPPTRHCTAAILAEPRVALVERIRQEIAAGRYDTSGRVDECVEQILRHQASAAAANPWTVGDQAELHVTSGVYRVEVLDHADGYGVPAVRVKVLAEVGPVDPVTGLVVGVTGTFSPAELKPLHPQIDA